MVILELGCTFGHQYPFPMPVTKPLPRFALRKQGFVLKAVYITRAHTYTRVYLEDGA